MSKSLEALSLPKFEVKNFTINKITQPNVALAEFKALKANNAVNGNR